MFESLRIRSVVLLTILPLLCACVGRQMLTDESFRLESTVLEGAMSGVRVQAALVKDELRLGFSRKNEELWFRTDFLDRIDADGISVRLAALRTHDRLRQPGHRDRIPVLDETAYAATLRDAIGWLVPFATDQALMLVFPHKELGAWRDEAGILHTRPLKQLPAHIRVTKRISDTELLSFLLALMREHIQNTGDASLGRVVFTLPPNRPGTPGWIYLDALADSVFYVLAPFHGETFPEPVLRVSLKTLDRVVLRSHLVTVFKNPFTTLWRLLGQGVEMGSGLLYRNLGLPSIRQSARGGKPMDIDAWEQRLDIMTRTRRYFGRVTFLVGGSEFFPDLIGSIHSASESVDIRTYIFDNDDYAVGIANLLKEKSHEVPVRVLMDDLGSMVAALRPPPGGYPNEFRPPPDMARYLAEDSRVQVRRAGNPWLTGDHVKTTMIDGRLAYVGGMNIGAEYRYYWEDMMVRVEGPIVDRLGKEFSKAWAHAGPAGDFGYLLESLKPLSPAMFPDAAREPDFIPMRVLVTRTGRHQIFRAQLEAIRRARDHVYIITPYLTEPDMIDALVSTSRRGVDVRVVLPGAGNHNIMNSAHVFVVNRLYEAGVRVFVYPGMTHVKAGIFDGWATFGSANFDRLSFKVNQELNLAISHQTEVQNLQNKLFLPHFQQSREIKAPLEWTWQDYAASLLSLPF